MSPGVDGVLVLGAGVGGVKERLGAGVGAFGLAPVVIFGCGLPPASCQVSSSDEASVISASS